MSKERRVVLALGKEMDPLSIFCVSLSDYSMVSRKGVSWYKNTQVILMGNFSGPLLSQCFCLLGLLGQPAIGSAIPICTVL